MKRILHKKDDDPPLPADKKEAVSPTEMVSFVSNEGGDSLLKKIKGKVTKLFYFNSRTLEENVADLLEEHDPEGTQVGNEERALVHNVLGLSDKNVHDVMVPRTDIIAVDHTVSLNGLRQMIVEHEHTRIPVFKGTLDNVVGFLHIKDLIPILGTQKTFDISSLIREVLFVPPSMRIVDLLVRMRARRVHIALVLDEYGGTDGLVTMEDIVEEIVGDIDDEHDDIVEEDFIQIDPETYQVKGRMDVKELEKKLNVLLTGSSDEDFDTVGGLIFFILGRVPEKGEQITHSTGLVFEIVDADPRRIRKLIVRKPNAVG
jgi:magnesium and cobalt transporter